MAEVIARKCPVCAGDLPPLGDSGVVTCPYCGKSFDVKRTMAQPAAAPPAPAPMRVPAPAYAPVPVFEPEPRTKSRAGCVVGATAALLIAGAAAAVFLVRSSPGTSPGVLESSLTFMQTVGFAQANADGVDDVVMLGRTLPGPDEIWLFVVDGVSGRDLWRAGPYGGYGQALQFTHAAIVGRRVLVTDFRGQAHLVDVGTGAALMKLPLPDRVKDLAGAGPPGEVSLTLQNGNILVLDPATGATHPPEVIEIGGEVHPLVGDLSLPTQEQTAPSAPIPGLEQAKVVEEAGVRVAVGRRAAGIRVPMAVGLGPDGTMPLWTIVVPTVDETKVEEQGSDSLRFALGNGRLIVGYSLTGEQGARLAAFDARSGARLWESPVTGWADDVDVDALRLGPSRIVFEQFLEAEVFDAATGRLIRSVH